MAIKRILYASDLSPASRGAFKLAIEMAAAFKAELILCHAYQPLPPVTGEGALPPAVLRRAMSEARADSQQKLAELARSIKSRRVRASTLVAEGAAAEAIVTAAKKKRAQLVVLGTHGRTGLARMLMGSVAESVVRTAPCPVLTVRPGRS